MSAVEERELSRLLARASEVAAEMYDDQIVYGTLSGELQACCIIMATKLQELGVDVEELLKGPWSPSRASRREPMRGHPLVPGLPSPAEVRDALRRLGR